jgi:hypothetical protein
MSSYYVYIIRTDTDLDSGYGPYETRTQALAAQERLDERLSRFEWFDGTRLGQLEPQDGLYAERVKS